ncbi:hypothetical protein KKG71_07105 [Patescibacteria group bacterium]|nr:hypothetical protein [Patescibacteria group bacterium]
MSIEGADTWEQIERVRMGDGLINPSDSESQFATISATNETSLAQQFGEPSPEAKSIMDQIELAKVYEMAIADPEILDILSNSNITEQQKPMLAAMLFLIKQASFCGLTSLQEKELKYFAGLGTIIISGFPGGQFEDVSQLYETYGEILEQYAKNCRLEIN